MLNQIHATCGCPSIGRIISQVRYTYDLAAGARKAASALGRLMPNVGGPTQSKRRLLMSVVHIRLLYSASVWAEEVKCVARNLRSRWYHGPTEISFHVAQALTGHGCIQGYLWKKKKSFELRVCPLSGGY